MQHVLTVLRTGGANREFWWLILGFWGQLAFSARFLVQWISSERLGRSIVPVAFWWLSILGGISLLIYALYRQDPVFILGQAMGLIVYVRNLILIRRAEVNGAEAR